MNNSIKRLNRLSDLVFASSMTVLVLLLNYPTAEEIENTEKFRRYFLNELPNLYLFLVTFMVVAIYWIKDLDQYKFIENTDRKHIWFQLGSLAFIVLLPWINGLMEIKPDFLWVKVMYSLDMFFIGIFSYLAWSYACKEKHLVVDQLDDETIKNVKSQALSEPIVALIATGMVFIYDPLWDLTFLLIPLVFMFQKRIRSFIGNKILRNNKQS